MSNESADEADVDDVGAEIDPSDPLELLGELLEEIVDALGLDVEVDVEETDGVLTGSVAGDDVGLFIGRRGQTIDAVQHLAQRIVFRGGPVKARVVIDADGYRERRAKQLREDADDAADEALRLGSDVELDPMPASERRVVHEHLRERGDVGTHSEGEEPERYLVVSPLGD
ncbi:MAG TPA: R3H domain-containing nucleic acid-binding protein [Solirubrobacteraceae bacterium]|jgi:spoIIIJ-associated protein